MGKLISYDTLSSSSLITSKFRCIIYYTNLPQRKQPSFPHQTSLQLQSSEYALTMDTNYGPVFGKRPDFLTFKNAVAKTTEAFPLNSVMFPGTYQISPETVTEITGGKFDVENLVVSYIVVSTNKER
jgi:hypothetical protein